MQELTKNKKNITTHVAHKICNIKKKSNYCLNKQRVNYSASFILLLQADAGKYSIYKAASVRLGGLVYVHIYWTTIGQNLQRSVTEKYLYM